MVRLQYCPGWKQPPPFSLPVLLMDHADAELHRAKRELESLIARMQDSPHARTFLGYADALVFSALRDLPASQWESPKVHCREDLRLVVSR